MAADADIKLQDMIRTHAWSYFQLHAQQRLTTFNFYIVLSSVLTAGLFTAFEKNNAALIPGAIGLLLAVFSFVFAKLDVRNKQLIKNAERTLRELEAEWVKRWPNETSGTEIQLFHRDETAVEAAKRRDTFASLTDRHWSFSDCFGMAFWGLGTLGLGSLILSLVLWFAIAH